MTNSPNNSNPLDSATEESILTASLNEYESSADHARLVPIEWARRMRAVPALQQGNVVLLMEDAGKHELLDDIRLLLNVQPRPVAVSRALLDHAIERFYFQQAKEAGWKSDTVDGEVEPPQVLPASSDLLSSASAAPVVQFVNQTLLDAVRQGASDVHIEPESSQVKVRFRVDGLLHDRPSPSRDLQASLAARIKVMASLDIAEKRLPQDGTARVSVGRKEIDIRVSTIPVADGERIVLRLLHREQVRFGLSELGLPEELGQRFRSLLREPNGVIWVTGPTGSGKTTTLYAALQELDREHLNILTIEDPVEYRLDGVGQMSVKPSIGLTFETGLRHILRQDPDVVLVGETRDEETAEIVSRASLTGHLVFSTLHTNDAASAFTRLLDMNIPAYLLAGSTRASLGQRLVRKLCPVCKKTASQTNTKQYLDMLPSGVLEDVILYDAVGCDACREGYQGRMGIYELLVVDDALRQMIQPGLSASDVISVARKNGFTSMLEDGLSKVREGATTLAELDRVIGLNRQGHV